MTLEVRPRSASGLIFHLSTRRSHHLLLYMEETKVVGEWLPHRWLSPSPAHPTQLPGL